MNDEKIKTSRCTHIKQIDLSLLTKPNIYENVILCTKRAQQIDLEQNNLKKEKMKDWLDYNQDFLHLQEENDNIPQKISRNFEMLNKATNIAIEEFENGKLKKIFKEEGVEKEK